MEGPRHATYVFDSTTAALWAEEVAQAEGIPVEAIPAPADAQAKCDLALVTLADAATALEEVWVREGVPHRRWR